MEGNYTPSSGQGGGGSKRSSEYNRRKSTVSAKSGEVEVIDIDDDDSEDVVPIPTVNNPSTSANRQVTTGPTNATNVVNKRANQMLGMSGPPRNVTQIFVSKGTSQIINRPNFVAQVVNRSGGQVISRPVVTQVLNRSQIMSLNHPNLITQIVNKSGGPNPNFSRPRVTHFMNASGDQMTLAPVNRSGDSATNADPNKVSFPPGIRVNLSPRPGLSGNVVTMASSMVRQPYANYHVSPVKITTPDVDKLYMPPPPPPDPRPQQQRPVLFVRRPGSVSDQRPVSRKMGSVDIPLSQNKPVGLAVNTKNTPATTSGQVVNTKRFSTPNSNTVNQHGTGIHIQSVRSEATDQNRPRLSLRPNNSPTFRNPNQTLVTNKVVVRSPSQSPTVRVMSAKSLATGQAVRYNYVSDKAESNKQSIVRPNLSNLNVKTPTPGLTAKSPTTKVGIDAGCSDENVPTIKSADTLGPPGLGVKSNLGKKTYGRTKEAKEKSKTCLNDKCDHTSKDIVKAPTHVLFFFGISGTSRKHKICTHCLEKAENYVKKCGQAIKNKESMFAIPFNPGSVTTIALEGSSGSSDEEENEKEVIQVSQNLDKDVDKILASLGIDIAMDHCTKWLANDLELLEQGFKKLSKELLDSEIGLEDIRKRYDKLTGANKIDMVMLKPLDIDKFGNARVVDNDYVPKENIEMNPRKRKDRLGGPPIPIKIKPHPSATVVRSSQATRDDDMEICELAIRSKPTIRAVLAPTPPVLPRVMPKIGDKVFVMRTSTLNFWVLGEILEVLTHKKPVEFKVQFDVTKKGKSVPATNSNEFSRQVKILSGKSIAYNLSCPFILPVSTRVIARFHDFVRNEPHGKGNYYAGIVAESPKSPNNFRYMIFFDDGYAQYVNPSDVYLVCEASKDVWLDVDAGVRQFIKKYVTEYPERGMLRLVKGAVVQAEWKGEWRAARVKELDGSLVKLHFEAENRVEWFYRGSTRLQPIYNKTRRLMGRQRVGPSNGNIQYGYDIEDFTPEYANRVARKSTGGKRGRGVVTYGTPPSTINGMLTLLPSLKEYEGRMIRTRIPNDVLPPKTFEPHTCTAECTRPFEKNSHIYKKVNLLAIPLRLGFQREVAKTPRRTIFYRAPCGRRLRSYNDVQRFLVETQYTMSIDYFCFEFAIDCLSAFTPSQSLYYIDDITYQNELVPVPCINSVDHDYPDYVEYTKERLPSKDVKVNLDKGFLTCCDCEDDCLDKTKCACWKLTMEGIKKTNDRAQGYVHRRLYDHVVSGIYECNSRCHCKDTCSNRVAQNPMRWQLQVFKTSTKGWAIRPLYDIPQGAFICVYAGLILTEQGANEDGKEYGDEYLAELDYIEVMESVKEGYESGVIDPEDPEPRGDLPDGFEDDDPAYTGDESPDDLSGEEDFGSIENIPGRTIATRQSEMALKEEETKKPAPEVVSLEEEPVDNDVDDGDAQKEPSSFSADFMLSNENKDGKISTRQLFGPNELCYIMDAKGVGNIGRYLNHSCQPNVFVQNVFVDTHDIRFPWVAFFANKHIRAGTELTWDYNYDIGSVPDKTMYCYCGAPECRGRLL